MVDSINAAQIAAAQAQAQTTPAPAPESAPVAEKEDNEAKSHSGNPILNPITGAGLGGIIGLNAWKGTANCKYLSGLTEDKFEKALEKVSEENKTTLRNVISAYKEKLGVVTDGNISEGSINAVKQANEEANETIKALGKDAPKMKKLSHAGIAALAGAVVFGVLGHLFSGHKKEAPAQA